MSSNGSNKRRASNAANPNEAGGSSNKKKKAKKSPADEVLCPITLELPWDPVSAEDDRIYEREAIEKWIKSQQQQGQPLRSPHTNKAMGPALKPVPQIKNLIEVMIENESITGHLADKWKEKLKEKKKMEKMQKDAEAGKDISMYNLGTYYRDGSNGFKEDVGLAYKWLKKAHAKGFNPATGALGSLLVSNFSGTLPEGKENGLLYLGIAAGRGSDGAAHRLGCFFAHGYHGVTVDKNAAIYWLQQSLQLPKGSLSEKTKETARKKLEELQSST